MKKISFSIALTFLVLFFAISCHKKTAEEVLKEHMQTCANEYVHSEDGLGIANADSIIVHSIDTVTEMGYAKIVLELLENLEFQYKMMYDEATMSDNDQRIHNLEVYLHMIETQTDKFRIIEESEAVDNQQLLLYLISGTYYKGSENGDFICFANPDFTLHILDPFADNLIEK